MLTPRFNLSTRTVSTLTFQFPLLPRHFLFHSMTFSPLFQISLNEVSALISTLSTNSVARYELGQYKCTCDTVKYAAGIVTFKSFLTLSSFTLFYFIE